VGSCISIGREFKEKREDYQRKDRKKRDERRERGWGKKSHEHPKGRVEKERGWEKERLLMR
jgi:hypothetical protein